VVLKVDASGGPAEQTQWSIRCDGLHNARHPRLAALVDYGALGASQRFEAWQCGPPWRRAPGEAARTRHAISRYLRACGLTDGDGEATDVYEFDGRPVVVPNQESGYAEPPVCPEGPEGPEALEAPEVLEGLSLDNCAIRTIERHADALVTDLFASLAGSRPHLISIWGPPGSGRTTAALRAARVARLNGFVPIGVPILSRIDGRLL